MNNQLGAAETPSRGRLAVNYFTNLCVTNEEQQLTSQPHSNITQHWKTRSPDRSLEGSSAATQPAVASDIREMTKAGEGHGRRRVGTETQPFKKEERERSGLLCSISLISNIDRGQADSARLPKTTSGIQLKGCRSAGTASLSPNFLRRERESVGSSGGAGHCHLSPAVLFKGVFAFRNVSKPSSSLAAIFIPRPFKEL